MKHTAIVLDGITYYVYTPTLPQSVLMPANPHLYLNRLADFVVRDGKLIKCRYPIAELIEAFSNQPDQHNVY